MQRAYTLRVLLLIVCPLGLGDFVGHCESAVGNSCCRRVCDNAKNRKYDEQCLYNADKLNAYAFKIKIDPKEDEYLLKLQ